MAPPEVALPPGFELDPKPAGLPEGFALDAAPPPGFVLDGSPVSNRETHPAPDTLLDQASGVVRSFQRGTQSALRAVDVLGELTDKRVPTLRQGRRAFEQAMADPRYNAQLAEASRLELEDPAAGARRAAKAEELFGPPAKLEQLRRPIVTEQEARRFDIAQGGEKAAAIPQSQAMQRWAKADNSNWWQVFASDPVEIIANIAAESLPQSMAGMAAGAVLGSQVGPTGTAAGVGAGSFAVEYANSILQGAADAGFDMTKPEAVKAFFASPKALGEAKDHALKRGVPVAVLDAVSARLAGKFLGPAIGKGVRPVLAGVAKETAAQGVAGGTGEALAQMASGEKFSPKEIFAEVVGELASGPTEVATNIQAERARNRVTTGDGKVIQPEAVTTPPAGYELDAVPKTGTEQTPVTSTVTPPAEPKVDVTADLAAELQAALTGNQGKPHSEMADRRSEIGKESAPAVAPTPNSELRTPNVPLRFRAIVEEGKVPSELVIQPLTEELYDAVIHVEGLTPEFTQFKAENPEATHLKRQLLPTGKFAHGHKFGPLNELVPPGIGSRWEPVEDSGQKIENRPAQALPASLSALSSQPTSPQPATDMQPQAAPAPPDAVSPAPPVSGYPSPAARALPAGDSLPKPLTPEAAVPTVSTAAGQVAETITGPDERTGSGMPAEVEGAPTIPTPVPQPKSPQPKGLAAFQARFEAGRSPDLIDALDQFVGGKGSKISPALIREANRNWRPVGAARRLFSAQGRPADTVLNGFTYDGPKFGLAQDSPLDQFGDAINEAANARSNARKQFAREERAAKELVQQDEQFQQRVVEGHVPAKDRAKMVEMNVSSLLEGDRFEAQGFKFTVQEIRYDEDGRMESVTLKDGPKFGIQRVDPDGTEFIHVDKGSFVRKPGSGPAAPADEGGVFEPGAAYGAAGLTLEERGRSKKGDARQSAQQEFAFIAQRVFALDAVGAVEPGGDVGGQPDGQRGFAPLTGGVHLGLEGAVNSLRATRLLARSISEDLIQFGGTDVVGKFVYSARDLALLAQTFRHPQFEVCHWIFTKQGEVVGRYAVSLRAVGETLLLMPKDSVDTMRETMKALGADQYWLLHNHPTADVTPSQADILTTIKTSVQVPGFAGHVVIDHLRFAFINENGGTYVDDLPERNLIPDKLRLPATAASAAFAGVQVTGPAQFAVLAKTTQQHVSEGAVALFYLDNLGKTVALGEAPATAFTSWTDNHAAMGEIEDVMRHQGAVMVAAYYNGPQETWQQMEAVAWGLVKRNRLADFAHDRGQAMFSTRTALGAAWEPFPTRNPAERFAEEGAQYRTQVNRELNELRDKPVAERTAVESARLEQLERELGQGFMFDDQLPRNSKRAEFLREQLATNRRIIEQARREQVMVASEIPSTHSRMDRKELERQLRNWTADEQAAKDRLKDIERELAALESPEAVDKQKQTERDRAEVARRTAERLTAAPIEVQGNIFGERLEDKSGQGAFFSRGTGSGVSVEAAQARADELTGKWVLPFGVEVVQSWRDLPASARRGITSRDGHTVEGRYVPGSGVYLVADNLASTDRVLAVVLHEVLGHFGIDGVLGDQRDAFMLDVFRSFQGKPLFMQKARDYAADFENGRTPVTQADKVLLGRELVAAIAEHPAENPGLWQRIVDAVRRWLREIGWGQEVSEADIRAALRRAEQSLQGPRSAVSAPLEEAFASRAPESWAGQVKAVREGTEDTSGPLDLGTTPPVLQLAGADALPMVVNARTLRKVTEGVHAVPWGEIERLPQALADPIAVFQSRSQPDSLVVMTELREGDKTVVAAVHLNRRAALVEVNAIASLYGKESDRWFEQQMREGNALYAHQAKSRAWFRSRGLQLPKEGSARGNRNLKTEADIVNGGALSRLEPRELSGGGFYDTILEALKRWQPRGTPEQLMAHLGKTRGALEQAEWIGLPEFLQGKQSVTNAEVVKFARENAVEVREVVKGDRKKLWDELDNPDINIEVADQIHADLDRAKTKFSQYQLPGGENYRELLLTLPVKKASFEEWWKRTKASPFESLDEDQKQDWQPAYERYLQGEADRQVDRQDAFKSSHFSEPNILAHVRFNERTDAQGRRVLFIEEVQSDWHKEGRKQGYRTELPTKPTVREDENVWVVKFPDGRAIDIIKKGNTAESAIEAAIVIHRELPHAGFRADPDGVPDAPFKGTWPVLVMKRMLRWAAEHNFDAVAWITGDQTAARYDLSKQVDSIRITRAGEKDFEVKAVRSGNTLFNRPVEANKLSEMVGKDLAEKAQAMTVGTAQDFTGDNLKVGGEWARALYDRTLPNELNKLVKKWGGRVERAEITTSKTVGGVAPVLQPDGGYLVGEVWYSTRAAADEAANLLNKLGKAGTRETVHSLPLTPDLKDAALGGMPMFSRTAATNEPLADLLARKEMAAARGITYTAQREKLRAEGKTIPDSLKKAEREQADLFKEASFQLLRHPDYVAQQVRAVDAKLDELNTLKERQRILKQQGTDLESDARARLAELEHWLPDDLGEDSVPFQHADEFAGIPPSLVKQAIERTPGLKHFITEAEKERTRAILDNPNLSPEQKQRALDDIEKNRGRALAEVPLPNALPPRANVALATSTTLAGNQDARGWWEAFARYARNLASATPEIPLFGPLARLNVPMRGFLNAIRAGNMTAARDAETMVRDVVQPLLDLPRAQLDPNALARHQAIAKKLQFAERQFDQQAERMRVEIAMMEQARADRAAITERREALAEFEGNPPARIAELQKQLAEAVGKLQDNPMWLFKQAVLFRDYVSRFQMLAPKQQGRFKFPGNLSIQDVVNELERTNAAIEASPARDAIKAAMDRHYRAMTELEGELLKRGHLIPKAMKNGAYFPHQVLDYTSQHLGRLKPATEAPFRGYLIDPTGSRKAIETDYIQAIYRHAAEVMAHNAHQDAVEKFLKPLDRSESIRETVEAKAAAEGRTAGRFEWRSEDNLPPGHVFYDAARKLPLRLGYVLDPQTIADALFITLKDGDVIEQMQKLGLEFTLKPEMLQQALVAGEKQPWVIPKEVAEALDGILDRQRQEEASARAPFVRRLRQAVSLWKLNTLFAPWHYLRYEWGNTLSDVVDKLGGADLGMAKYLPQAFKEVIAFADKQGETKDIRAAFEQRVLDTVTFAEVEKVKDSPAFEQLRSDTQRALATAGNFAKGATFPVIPIIRLLSGANVRSTVELSRLREATFRYAKFLADLDRIRNGQNPVYAGAYWKDVEAEGTPEEKAALIARRTFGDYGDLSVSGEWLRKNLVPFYSWTEINFRYHANLLRNMADMIRQGEFGSAAQSAWAVAAWTALRLALPYAAVHLWNTVGGAMAGAWDDDDDLEATLSEADRRRFHLILGKDERGQTRVVYLPTAFSDVVSWFGGDNAARLLAEYARGDITFERVVGDFAKQIGPDTLNKVAQSTGPVGKGAFIAISGKQPFPDITNMRSVAGREKWFAVVQTMTDREGTDLLRRAFDNDYYPRPAGEVAKQLILQIRRRDPEQWAFYEVKEKVSDWKERKTGKRFEAGDYSAPEAQALRNFRRAVYLGDADAAERFYTKLLGYGYTSERLKASIRNQHPLAELNEEGRREFVRSLSRADREQLRRALQYWERLGTLKGKERGLFPAKAGQRFTPQAERLQRAVLEFDRKPDEEVRRQAERLVESALTGRR